MSSAAAAAAIPDGPSEQNPTCQQKDFSSQRGEPCEQQQWSVHQHLKHLLSVRVHQHGPSVHLESGLHFSDLRAAFVLFLLLLFLLFFVFILYAAFLPGHLHACARIQSTLRRHSVLFQWHGLWLLPRAYASPAEWPRIFIHNEPQKHEHGQHSPESVMFTRNSGLRHFRSRD